MTLAFGGDITYASVVGEFTEVAAAEFEAYKQRVMDEAWPRFAGKRILLVEDEAPYRMVARRFLEPLQVIIDEASNGKEAIERVQSARYDLIVMDLNMPEMNDYEATEWLRVRAGGDQGRTVLIVAHTSEPPYIAQGKIEKVGMQGLLPKPCTQPELILALGEQMTKTAAPPPARTYAGKSVLVVEDVPTNRLFIRQLLEGVGIQVTEAAEGRQPSRRWRSSPVIWC